MSEARAKILADFAMWTALSALRSGVHIKSRRDVYGLLRATAFEALFDAGKGPIDTVEFEAWHRNAVEELRRLKPSLNIGWAAKLINVYLKTRAYVGGDGRPNLCDHLHPPIDRGLWDGLWQRFGRGSQVTKRSHCVKRIKDIDTQERYDRIIEGCRMAADALECKLIEVDQLWTATALRVQIVWREWDTLPSCQEFGHGVHFHDLAIADEDASSANKEDASLVAFVEGYAWLKEYPIEVVIHCIKPNPVTSPDVLCSMKQRIERLIKSRQLAHGQITPRISAWFNA